jgi:hypothetical protein
VRSLLAAAAVRHFENFFKSFANVPLVSPVVPLESSVFTLGEFGEIEFPPLGCAIVFVVVSSTAFFTACTLPAKPLTNITDDAIAMVRIATTVMLENIILLMTTSWL